MKRREALQTLGLISSHALFPSVLSGFLTSCANKEVKDFTPIFFSESEYSLIVEVIDIIIPATTTQSASQVNTHIFLDQVFAACLTPDQQHLIKEGLAQLASDLYEADDKNLFLSQLDKKAYADDEASGYFKLIKQYTMIGFFTSQEGSTKASNYVKISDGYKGEIPLNKNTLNYADTSLHFYL